MPTIVPIVDQSRGWRYWYYDEIYTTPLGVGRYVPNVNDAVWSWELGLQRVTAVNYLTGESTLVSHTFTNNNGGVLAVDALLGSGPGSVSESFRVYVNTTVSPPTMAVDRRLHITVVMLVTLRYSKVQTLALAVMWCPLCLVA